MGKYFYSFLRILLFNIVLTAIASIAYAALSFLNEFHWYMIPGLALGKISGNAMLVLLNNRFTILGGRNSSHPDFDIPSYRQSVTVETSTSTGVSRGIAFAHSRPTDTTFISAGVHTVDLTNPRLERVSEESNDAGGRGKKLPQA